MLAQKHRVVVEPVVSVKLPQFIQLPCYILPAQDAEATAGFHPAESAVVEASVGNCQRDHVVFHVPRFRRQDGDRPADDIVKRLSPLFEATGGHGGNAVDEYGLFFRKPLPVDFGEFFRKVMPCRKRLFYLRGLKLPVAEYGVGLVGKAGDVVFAGVIVCPFEATGGHGGNAVDECGLFFRKPLPVDFGEFFRKVMPCRKRLFYLR